MASSGSQGTWGNNRAAAYLGCTPHTLRVWVSQRRIPHIKVGRLTRFLKEDLDVWLENNKVPAGANSQSGLTSG